MTKEPTDNHIANSFKGRVESVITNTTVQSRLIRNATEKIRAIRVDIESTGKSMQQPFRINIIPSDVAQKYESLTGIRIESKNIYTSVRTLTHHRNGQKETKGKVLGWDDFEKIPSEMPNMEIYELHGDLVYTDRNIKLVVKTNYSLKINRKKRIVSNHISSSKVVDRNEFSNPQYRKIK